MGEFSAGAVLFRFGLHADFTVDEKRVKTYQASSRIMSGNVIFITSHFFCYDDGMPIPGNNLRDNSFMGPPDEFETDVEKAAAAFHNGGQEFLPAVHLSPEAAEARTRTSTELTMKQTLMKQHPIHGVFADVFDRLGGSEFLYGWAAENPDKFLNMFSRMTPSLSPSTGHHGDIKITVNTAISKGALDG